MRIKDRNRKNRKGFKLREHKDWVSLTHAHTSVCVYREIERDLVVRYKGKTIHKHGNMKHPTEGIKPSTEVQICNLKCIVSNSINHSKYHVKSLNSQQLL